MENATITVGLVVPVKQHEKIRRAADKRGVTVSDFLRGIIKQHVPGMGDLKPPAPAPRPRKRYVRRARKI